MEKNQIWFCKCCSTRSSIPYEEGEDAYSVITRLRESHRRLSPNCEDPSKLRILNEEKATPEETKEAMSLHHQDDPAFAA
jgi:hypothetical protein